MRFCLAFLCLLPLFLCAQPAAEMRRRYEPTVEFLNFKGDHCFEITRKEADRAFNLRYWEDASLLYRAAKNCSDASQALRLELNKSIELCRTNAENALRQKELEARMQARQAQADKLANDAQTLLRNFDRSTAFRLADFANSYVAPPGSDGNPECRQAILDAWNYVPYLQSGLSSEYADLQVPFCFELTDNLGENVMVRFAVRKDTLVLYAFIPEKHLLYTWKTEAFIPEIPLVLDKDFLSMDVLNDHETLLFSTKNGFVFWRSMLESRSVTASENALYYHDQHTKRFYFYERNEGEIRYVDLSDDSFSNLKYQQQQQQNQRSDKNRASEVLYHSIHDSLGLVSFSMGVSEMWMAFPKGLFIVSTTDDSKPTRFLRFSSPIYGYGVNHMFLEPNLQSLVVANDSITYFFYVSDTASTLPGPRNWSLTRLLSHTPMGTIIASKSSSQGAQQLYIQDKADGSFLQTAWINEMEEFVEDRGDFSPGDQWFASPTYLGKVKLWHLFKEEGVTILPYLVSKDGGIAFSPQGTYYGALFKDSMHVFPTLNSEQSAWEAPAYPESNFVALSEQWAAWQWSEETVAVRRIDGNKVWKFQRQSWETNSAFAFSSDNKMVAYSRSDSVLGYALESGRRLFAQTFEGAIRQLVFVPQSKSLLVVHDRSESALGSDFAVKLWHTDRPQQPVVFRVPQYEIMRVALSGSGDWVAFSNNQDVRIYHAGKPSEELVKIRAYKGHEITALRFVPGRDVIAAGYVNGEVVLWDVQTGRLLNKISPYDIYGRSVSGMYFPENEQKMIQHYSSSTPVSDGFIDYRTGTYVTRSVDPATMRERLITPNMQLVSFSADQIRDYELEPMLQYPGNFERLAQSGDLPLIRSFFNYYVYETFNSNNVERVEAYCNRAAVLYKSLNPASQEALQTSMVDMHLNLGWKLLLNHKSKEAEAVARDLRLVFGESQGATLMDAHGAILNNECSPALRKYADWIISGYASYYETLYFNFYLDKLQEEVSSLFNYGLLNESQISCLCAMLGKEDLAPTFCTAAATSAAPMFDAITLTRWEVFTAVRKANKLTSNVDKIPMLESARRKAQTLRKNHPTDYNLAVRSLSKAWYGYGLFERGNTTAVEHFGQAVDLLNGMSDKDTVKMARIVQIDLQMATVLLQQNKLEQAAAVAENGLVQVGKLLETTEFIPWQNEQYKHYLESELYKLLARIRLFQNRPQMALKLYKQAEATSADGLNTIYFGEAYALAGETAKAMEQFETGLYNEEVAGLVVSDLDLLSAQIPEKKDQINTVQQFLFARLTETGFLNFDAIQFYRYKNASQQAFYEEKWANAVKFNKSALLFARLKRDENPDNITWSNHWIDANINHSFLLLFANENKETVLTEVINNAREGLAWVAGNQGTYTSEDYILTNLAHALWLRNKDTDREEAIRTYRSFLNSMPEYSTVDYWELLLKDFRDVQRSGTIWPELSTLLEAIKPANH